MKTKYSNIYKGLLAVALTAAAMASCSDDYAEAPATLPPGGVGTGRWDNPMTAYQVHIGSVNEDFNPAWVHGYIVGICNVDITNVLSSRTIVYDQGFNVATNILLADSPVNIEYVESLTQEQQLAFRDSLAESVITVQLPSGSVRNALNLADNPNNLGKEVCIKGETGSKYCSVYGLRSCSDFNWGPQGLEEADVPTYDGGAFYQDFEATTDIDAYIKQGWKNVEVTGGLSGWYVRNFGTTNYITVSAYNGTADGGPYVNWLITPPIDMEKLTDKTLEFITQAAYTADDSILEVYVMTTDDPFTSQSRKLDAAIATPPSSGYSSWVNSGKLDLSAYSGVIYIGWRYYSAHGGSNGSTTYCVDNVNVGNAPTAAE